MRPSCTESNAGEIPRVSSVTFCRAYSFLAAAALCHCSQQRARTWNTKMRMITLALVGTILGITPCLGQEAQVSPEHYRQLTCLQIVQESHAVSKRGFALIGSRANRGGTEGYRRTTATVIVLTVTSKLKERKLADNMAQS